MKTNEVKTGKKNEQELRELGKQKVAEQIEKNKAKTHSSKPFIAEEFSATESEEKEILNNTKKGKTTNTVPVPAKKEITEKPEKPTEKVKEEKPEKVKKEKPEKVKEEKETLHRQDSVTQAIRELCKKGATMKEIMNRANEIHISKGGESNPTATNVNRYTLFALVAFNILSETESGVYTLNQ